MSENKKSVFNEIIRPALVLTVITLVTALCLALTNAGTKEVIKANAEKELLRSKQEILPAAEAFSEEKEEELNGKTFKYIEGTDASGEIVGYIFQNSTPGYNGPVTALVAIDTEGKIVDVNALDLNETPNVGMLVGERDFLDQFAGHSGEIALTKEKAAENEVQAVTGATISSAAFLNSVNEGLAQYAAVSGNAPEPLSPEEQACPDAAEFSEEKTVEKDEIGRAHV